MSNYLHDIILVTVLCIYNMQWCIAISAIIFIIMILLRLSTRPFGSFQVLTLGRV